MEPVNPRRTTRTDPLASPSRPTATRASTAWQRIDRLWEADMARLHEAREQAPRQGGHELNLEPLGYTRDQFGRWVAPGTNRL